MAKIIKRRNPSVQKFGTESMNHDGIADKFRQEQQKANDKLSLNKEVDSEALIKKVLVSNLAPIIHLYYIDHPPVILSVKTPYYSRAGFEKSIKMLRKALRGTLFNDTEFRAYHDRKFTIDEILASITNHKLAMTPEYKPADKKFLKVPLEQFLYNPYAKSIGKSFLLYWMGVDPIPMLKPIQDPYPEITSEVIKSFEWGNLSYEDSIHVIKGVIHFKEILSTVKFSPIYRITPKKEAEILWLIISDLFDIVGKPPMPRNLVSPKFEGWIREGLKKSDYTL